MNAQLETTVVSNAIVKISALLSILFVSAGAEIIGKNIVQEGDTNPMFEGKKKCFIFRFWDIRKFTDINENLDKVIFIFVNKISSIFQKAICRYWGSAKKNIGEAFLCGRTPRMNTVLRTIATKLPGPTRYLSILADFFVYSFIKILAKLTKALKPFNTETTTDSLKKSPATNSK